MRRILITGKDSYIGSNFKKYMEQFKEDYYVEELDVRDDCWKEFDFTSFDVVFHVAGLAHMKEKKENESLYFKINTELTYEIAKKAKQSKIRQFIFMSSMSVYGLNHSDKPINRDTIPNPNTYYGISKLNAESLIKELEDDNFRLCILRPPMVYGEGSPGNLTKLFNLVKKVHIFPTLLNKRSSITVTCLVQFIKEYIDNRMNGTFFPQNNEYMCTVDIVKCQMKKENIRVIYTPVFNWLIKKCVGKISLISKIFGNLIYE